MKYLLPLLYLLSSQTLAFCDEPVSPEVLRAEFEKGEENDPLLNLAKQVESLKNRVVVQAATNRSTQAPRNVKVKGATTVFNYRPDSVYDIYSGVDFVTDIQLKPGESLTTPPTAGDTVRWNLSVMKSGIGEGEQTHLVIKPLEEEIETNLIVTTTEHIYQLRLHGTNFHMPAVTWNYPQDKARIIEEEQKRKSKEEGIGSPLALKFNYELKGKDYAWKPLRVFDDGKKTFIQMPPGMRTSDAPALFLIDDNGETILTNYRVKGNYYIVDRLFSWAELRVGTDSAVTIKLDDGRNLFERIFG